MRWRGPICRTACSVVLPVELLRVSASIPAPDLVPAKLGLSISREVISPPFAVLRL